MGKSARNGVSPIATFDHQMVISPCSNRITKNDSPVETPKYLSLPKNGPSTAKWKKIPWICDRPCRELGHLEDYPLVNIQKAIKNGHRNSGFTHWKWWFSIVMLVYQRVLPSKNWFFLGSMSIGTNRIGYYPVASQTSWYPKKNSVQFGLCRFIFSIPVGS